MFPVPMFCVLHHGSCAGKLICVLVVWLTASDVSEIENLDELEVYGDSDKDAGTTLTSYVFEVSCDRLKESAMLRLQIHDFCLLLVIKEYFFLIT